MTGVLIAFAVALVTTPMVLVVLRRRGVWDEPNTRSSHSVPTPRGGGFAVAVGTVAGALLSADLSGDVRTGPLVASIGLGVIGLVDDLRSVTAAVRLASQVAFGAIAMRWLLVGLDGPLAWKVVFAIGCVVWIIAYVNAFNFMDGINGISAAHCAVAGGAWWFIGSAEGLDGFALAGAVVAAAALGFAPFNFPRSAVFLGDVGSYFVGSWFAGVAIVGLRAGLPPEAVFAPLSLYLADTATTLVRRALAGEVLHEAHRDHAYQRLTQAGWTHTRTTIVVAATMALCSALGAATLTDSLAVRAAADVCILGVLALYVASPGLVGRGRRGHLQVA